MPPNIEVVTNDALGWAVAGEIAGFLRRTAQDRIVSIALSGGRTPRPVYAALADVSDIRWGNVIILQTDERDVPADHPRSNFRLIQSAFLNNLHEPPSSVIRMEAGTGDLTEAATRYEDRLPTSLDLAVLGIGEDGHIASIFPGDESIWESNEKVMASQSPDGEARLTLTPKYLAAASEILLFASGSSKAEALRLALDPSSRVNDVPAALCRDGRWILDQEAAAGLGRHRSSATNVTGGLSAGSGVKSDSIRRPD